MNDDELLPEEVRDVIPLLGLYALGALDAEERVQVEDALASSELARMLYRDVAEAAAALREADPAHIDDRDEPPPELEQRILTAARRRRSTRWTAVATAAAGVVVLAVAGRMVLVGADPPPPPREAVTFAASEGVEVLEADLIAHTWGTELELVIEGVEAGVTYTVAFLDDDGDRVDAGSFLGVSDQPVDCRMNAAVLRDDVTGLVVRDATGTIVLEAELA